MDGEAARHTVVRVIISEVRGICFCVVAFESCLFGGVTGGVDGGLGLLGWQLEGVHLDEVDVGERFAQASFLQPLLPRAEDERDSFSGSMLTSSSSSRTPLPSSPR